MGIVVPQYETTQQANPPMAPTLNYAPGEQMARGVSALGQGVQSLAGDLMKVQDRDARIEATSQVAQIEADTQTRLLAAADKLGDSDPTGFAGEFNDEFGKMRDKAIAEADNSKNPYLSRHLSSGLDELRRRTFMGAMKAEHDAGFKYNGKRANDFVASRVKVASLNPGVAPASIMAATEYINSLPMPAQWKAEASAKSASAIAEVAVGTLIANDPLMAKAILGDTENPLTSSLDADTFARLKPQAENAAYDFTGRTDGRALAAAAFKSQDPTMIDKAVAKIEDQRLRDITEKYAQAEFNGLIGQQNQVARLRQNEEYDLATKAALNGQEYTPTGRIESAKDQQEVMDYYVRLKEQMLYQREGGALSDDMAYFTDVQAMLYSADKTAILNHHLDRTRLSERSFKTFNGAIERIRGDRNSKISDVGPFVDRAMVEARMTSPADKQRTAVLKMVMTDMVAQREQELGRPLQDAELRKLATDAFSQKYTPSGWFSSTVPAAIAVKPNIGTRISAALANTSTPVDFATIAKINADIFGPARDTIERIIREENPDADVTDEMIVDRYMQEYAKQYPRQ